MLRVLRFWVLRFWVLGFWVWGVGCFPEPQEHLKSRSRLKVHRNRPIVVRGTICQALLGRSVQS